MLIECILSNILRSSEEQRCACCPNGMKLGCWIPLGIVSKLIEQFTIMKEIYNALFTL